MLSGLSCLEQPKIAQPDATADPFLTALTPAQRRQMSTSLLEGNVPVFRAVDGRLELLSGCHYPVGQDRLRLAGLATPTKLTVEGASQPELSTKALSGVASTGHSCGSQFVTHASVVGNWRLELEQPHAEDLIGPNCQGATHVPVALGIGAFATYDLGSTIDATKSCSGDAMVPRSITGVLAQDGALSNCTLLRDGLPPDLCDIPVQVSLTDIRYRGSLEYYFDDRVIEGVLPDSRAMTSDELKTLGESLRSEVGRLAREHGIDVRSLPGPDGGSIHCRVSASVESFHYTLECYRGDSPILQESGEADVLSSLIPIAAERLIQAVDPTTPAADETSDLPVRIAILVDVSGSMIVNDTKTFTAEDIRRSQRYQIVDGLLRGLLENRIEASVAIIPFSGTGCSRPLEVDGKGLWSPTESARAVALDEGLTDFLRSKQCASTDGTNIAEALSEATQLLGRDSEHGAARSMILLVTDGAHNTSSSTVTPADAGVALRSAGAILDIVRIQRNDLRRFRKLGPRQRTALFAGWAEFLDEDPAFVQQHWLSWVESVSSNNDDGRALLDDLADVDATIDNFILGANDVLSDPLLIVHEYLLPQAGGIAPVEVARCGRAQILESGRVVQFYCDMQLPLGRAISVRVGRPHCMNEVSEAYIQVAKHPVTALAPMWDNGATVAFMQADFGDVGSTPQADNELVSARLTVEGTVRTGATRCDD